MIKYSIILSLCLLTSCSSANRATKLQRVRVIKENQQPKNYHSMIVCSRGSVMVRLFMDRLSKKLEKQFVERGIEYSYQYLGSEPKAAAENLKAIIHENKYDAILIFDQADISEVTEISGYIMPRSIALDQEFTVKIYDGQFYTNLVWDAVLKINCELMPARTYSTITVDIFRALKENKITSY